MLQSIFTSQQVKPMQDRIGLTIEKPRTVSEKLPKEL